MDAVKKYYAHFFIFLCIYLEFGYTVVVANYISGYVRYAILIVAMLLLILLFNNSRRTNHSLFLLLYSCLAVSFSIIRDYTLEDHFLLIVKVIIGYLVATRIPLDLCIKSFCNVIYYLTIYSLIIFILCIIFPSLGGAFPLIGRFHDTPASIHNALLSVIIYGSQFPRNFGITWEPGAFALLLCVAVFCSVFCFETINKKRMVVYILGIVSTFSTMGYIVLAAIFAAYLFMKSNKNIAFVLLLVLIAFGTFQIPFMQELTFGKLEGLFSASDNISETTTARLNAIVYPGMAFLHNPFIGVGYKEFKVINETLCNNVATNTILNWFAIYGIMLGLPFLLQYLYSIYRFLKNQVNWSIILLILLNSLLLISTESLLRISFIYVIIFIGTLKSQNVNIKTNG